MGIDERQTQIPFGKPMGKISARKIKTHFVKKKIKLTPSSYPAYTVRER